MWLHSKAVNFICIESSTWQQKFAAKQNAVILRQGRLIYPEGHIFAFRDEGENNQIKAAWNNNSFNSMLILFDNEFLYSAVLSVTEGRDWGASDSLLWQSHKKKPCIALSGSNFTNVITYAFLHHSDSNGGGWFWVWVTELQNHRNELFTLLD